MLKDLLPRSGPWPRMLGQWKFDRGFRLLLVAFTDCERLVRDVGAGAEDAGRGQCRAYRIRNRIHAGLSVLGETRLRTSVHGWRHVREAAKEADECLAYAVEALEYEEVGSAQTDLERSLEGLRECLVTIRTRSTLRYRSWPLDPWKRVARRVMASEPAKPRTSDYVGEVRRERISA